MLNREWLEAIAHLQLSRLALTILDAEQSRIVSIDFIDNPYHGDHSDEERELCPMAPKDATTTWHRYWTAYVVSSRKRLTLAMTDVQNYSVETELLLADSSFFNERVIRRS